MKYTFKVVTDYGNEEVQGTAIKTDENNNLLVISDGEITAIFAKSMWAHVTVVPQ